MFPFAVTIPWFIYSIIKVVMRNMLLKKSSAEIGKEVAKDVAVAVGVAVVDALTGSAVRRFNQGLTIFSACAKID